MLILDRYILKQFVYTLLFSLIALCVIFLIVNLIENLDEFLDQNATLMVIVKYYVSFFPEILKNLTPVATLLSTLFTVGRLSGANEITAMKSGSMSLYRIMVPFIIFTLALSLGQLYFNGWVVPRANESKIEIERKYLSKGSSGAIHNLNFRDNPYRNIRMQYYDAARKTGNRISIEDFDSDLKPRLVHSFEAKKMVWDSAAHNWMLHDVIERNFYDDRIEMKSMDSLQVDLRITHDKIMKLKRSVDEMNFDELREYIDILKAGGKDVRMQMIEYYGDYAFPFANFIVILFGVPFASVRKKGGIAIQIAAAMVVTFVYLVFSKVSQTIGYASNIDPILSGWMANIFFLIFGIFILIRTKT